MVAHAFTLEQRQSDMCVRGQPDLHSNFQVSQVYTARPYVREKYEEEETIHKVVDSFGHHVIDTLHHAAVQQEFPHQMLVPCS